MAGAATGVTLLAPLTVVDSPAEEDVPHPPPPRVLLVVEGSYPVAWGGVSTWCDTLIRGLPQVPFHVLAIVPQPGMPTRFPPPPNLVDTRTVPLWNLQDVAEARRDVSLLGLRRTRSATRDVAVSEQFLQPLRRFVRALLAPETDLPALAYDIHALYRFLVDHDLGRAMRHPAVWATFVEEAQRGYRADPDDDARPDLLLWELTTGFQWLARWLFPIARRLPDVDVVHLAMAGSCTVVAVAAKLDQGAGFLLTEHGVYLRERYLAEADRRDSLFLKLLALGFARRMTELSYRLADQISPCCDYNQRWERASGADPAILRTIYYGLDGEDYRPVPRPDHDEPTVVWVGRINPLKDVETLLRAAARVAEERPDVRFRLYGGSQAEDAEYHQRCLALRDELGLADTVTFCGYTSNPTAAYAEGDVVALTSVSEGFPYSILEAMLCGRPVVATAVGGIPEQLEEGGITVEPRSPQAMADGLLTLLNDRSLARSLGVAARERAATEFTCERFEEAHYSSYLRLSPRHAPAEPLRRLRSAPVPAASTDDPAPALYPRRGAVLDLAGQVHRRTWWPVDAFEVTALIESAGVTDTVARSRYGHPTAFALAQDVYDVLRQWERTATGPSPTARARDSDPVEPVHSSRLDTARHPTLALLPTVALLTAILAFTRLTTWRPDHVLALVIGITTGMVCTTGVALALVRRGSVLLSLGKIHALVRYIAWALAVSVAFTTLVAAVLSAPRWTGLEFIAQHRPTFVGTATVMAALWTLAMTLSLVSASGWTGVALLAGVLAGLGLDIAARPVPAHHVLSVGVGLVVTAGVMVWGLTRGLRARVVDGPSPDRTLPSFGFALLEGLPYVAYGTVAAAMFFAVHVVAWRWLGYQAPQVLTLELGLFLPLAPALLALGPAERGVRDFWLEGRRLQRSVPAAEAGGFGAALGRVFLRNSRHYLVILLVTSLATVALVEALVVTDWFGRFAPWADVAALQTLVLTGLVAYALFGWAQLNGTYCLALRQWRQPLGWVLLGIAVTLAVGTVIVATVGYQWLALALAGGSVVYGIGTLLAARRAIAVADHHYVTVV